MIKLELPWPQNINHYKRIGRTITTKKGKRYQIRYNSPKTKLFYYEVWQIVMKHRREGLKSFGGATISMELYVYPPDKRKRDIDGVLKCCLDSMQHAGLYDDDSQITRLFVEKMDTIEKGKINVRIKEI